MSSEEVHRSSEERTEELLLPEGVLGSGHRSDEGVLTSVGITVCHQVCCCLGHLYPAQAGLNLKLFHHLACLTNTHSAVNGGLPFHPEVTAAAARDVGSVGRGHQTLPQIGAPPCQDLELKISVALTVNAEKVTRDAQTRSLEGWSQSPQLKFCPDGWYLKDEGC